MRLRNYGWIYAGVTSLIFSILIFIVSVVIWVLAAFAIKHFHAPDCKIQYDNFYDANMVRKYFTQLFSL